MTSKEVTVLLVEDDDFDVEAVIRAFRKAKVANPVVVAEDGVEALEMLRGDGGKPKVRRPYLVLLDLNMPRMSGLEFLKALRADPELTETIVFVLTTSDHERDRHEAYKEHVAGYLVKDRVGDDFLKLINMLDSYWRVVEFPESTG